MKIFKNINLKLGDNNFKKNLINNNLLNNNLLNNIKKRFYCQNCNGRGSIFYIEGNNLRIEPCLKCNGIGFKFYTYF